MIDQIIEKYDVVLGSKSPRRKELLQKLIPTFKIIAPAVKEDYSPLLVKEEIATFLAELKSATFTPNENQLIITADTIVCIKDEVLGKPKDQKEAHQMLKKLSGETHQVITGVTIKNLHKKITFHDKTDVTFYHLSENEITNYIKNCKPFDKAGSYGIQEWMGYFGISKMNGDYFNVMGLPIHLLYRKIQEF
ncbi:MAG: Maf family nucleotide pyrophosphatase [Parvicellaceae bacterium]